MSTTDDTEANVVANLPEKLRQRTCPPGLPHTGDDPAADHGHTDCWLMQLAATEIERLREALAARNDTEPDTCQTCGSDDRCYRGYVDAGSYYEPVVLICADDFHRSGSAGSREQA